MPEIRISEECRDLLRKLPDYVKNLKHEYILPEHLLDVLLETPEIGSMVEGLGGDPDGLRKILADFYRTKVETVENTEPEYSISVSRIFAAAQNKIFSAQKPELGLVDLFIAVYTEEQSFAVYLLETNGISCEYAMEAASEIEHPVMDPNGEEPKTASALSQYAVCLNELAEAGKIDELVGREKEISIVLRTLSRRKKNNPLLIGEPGVGKTAVVEGLARMTVEGKVPDRFKSMKLFALDMGALTAGTKFRGQFEERLKKLMTELESQPESVLFIDEIHTVVGAGAAGSGSLDASNLLKPALNAGRLRCIGATTHEEYRNHILKDKAFSRRFRIVDVPEPTGEETLRILRGAGVPLERHYGVEITDDALERAVAIASKHIFDKFMPDKALDLIDEAAAYNAMEKTPLPRIDAKEFNRIAAKLLDLPDGTASDNQADRLRGLHKNLLKKIKAQDEAVNAAVQAVKLSFAGLGDKNKPSAAFLFAGPTGVGKTELAKQIAENLGMPLVRFDMSEYTEEYAVSRLIGSSPGYVGFEQGGMLTEQILRKPCCVLLLDEIEKAHRKIYDLLLQVMDYGVLTDNTGRKADFRNVILIMTSNAGAGALSENTVGFAPVTDTDSKCAAAIRKHFTPEFRNRLDGIISFRPLPKDAVKQIAEKFITETAARLREKNVKLNVSSAALTLLAEKGFDEKNGARPMARLIQNEITAKLAEEVLFGKLVHGGSVTVGTDRKGNFTFQYGKKTK